MRTALVAIAKNEDYYIDEWIDYNLKLGFDDIFIYQNNWRAHIKDLQNPRIHLIEFDGDAKQLEAYSNFIIHQSSPYDWAAFFDIDEFLVIKRQSVETMNVNSWLSGFGDYYAVGVNWRMFGDNGLVELDYSNLSVVNRFTCCSREQNRHIKSILNLSKCRRENMVDFTMKDPHSFNAAYYMDFTISTDKSHFIRGPFNTQFDESVQLNHYFCKTLCEFVNIKVGRGRADIRPNSPSYKYSKSLFDESNHNDVEDLYARDFLKSKTAAS